MPVPRILEVAQDQVYQISPLLPNDIIMVHQKDHLDYMVTHLLHLHHLLEVTSVWDLDRDISVDHLCRLVPN
jgi:hypothetical protein